VNRRFTVQVPEHSLRFDCLEGDRLLHAMEKQGLTCIPVGCRNGGCGRCLIQVTEGDFLTGPMSALHVSPESRARGYALACRVYPKSGMTVRPAAASECRACTAES
jgi:ferredoxin